MLSVYVLKVIIFGKLYKKYDIILLKNKKFKVKLNWMALNMFALLMFVYFWDNVIEINFIIFDDGNTTLKHKWTETIYGAQWLNVHFV